MHKDNRQALEEGTILPFDGMPVSGLKEIGRGSNAVVYTGSYPDQTSGQKHLVVVKELFPRHSGIFRAQDGHIVCRDPSAAEAFDIHQKSFQMGNEAHLALQQKQPGMGANLNINTFSYGSTLYTVLAFSGGRSLEEEYETHAPDIRRLTQHMLALLHALEGFHSNGLLHLDIAPDNILITGEGPHEQVILIDFNTVMPVDPNERKKRDEFRSIKPGYVSPEVKINNPKSIGVTSDLFSVAAVFYRYLAGQPISSTHEGAKPAYTGFDCLSGQPQTVSAQVEHILTRALRTNIKNRFQNIEQMRSAFLELLDRVDGMGVTHAALWEAGRRMVEQSIRQNPALRYLRDEASLYPSRVEHAQSGGTLEKFIGWLTGPDGRSTLFTAPGGMGKTTALLRTAGLAARRYSSAEPAMVYLPLYSCTPGAARPICDWLLQRLHTHSHQEAMQKLRRLMEKPLASGKPALCLLLDGLNELQGPADALVREINELARLDGVRILLTSRSAESALALRTASLAPLYEQDVEEALSLHGVMPPRSDEMRILLQTPMMLSIFIASAQMQQQFALSTQAQLLDAYLQTLMDKEMQEMPDIQGRRFQIDAAIRLVLPAIAQAMQKGVPDKKALLTVVKQCWQLTWLPALGKLCSEWIGHGRDIRGAAQSADDWYGIVVDDLLWKRLGLLVRDEHGRYHVFHQIIWEHLLQMQRQNVRIIRHYKRTRAAAVLAAALVALWCVVQAVTNRPYDEYASEELFRRLHDSYTLSVKQFDTMRRLAQCAMEQPQNYATELQIYNYEMQQHENNDRMMAHLQNRDTLLQSGGTVIPWSYEKLDADLSRDVFTFAGDIRAEYAYYINGLTFVMEDDQARQTHGAQAAGALLSLIGADAQIAEVKYHLVCDPHITDAFFSTLTQGRVDRKFFVTAQADRAQLREKHKILDEMIARRNLQAARFIVLLDGAGHYDINLWEQPNENPLNSARGTLPFRFRDGDAASRVLDDWLNVVFLREQLCGDMLWAMEYAQQYVCSPSWDNLLRARAAVSTARQYLANRVSFTPKATDADDQALTQENTNMLNVQLETAELDSAYTAAANGSCDVLEFFLYHDMAFWQPGLDWMKDWLEQEQDYYAKHLRSYTAQTVLLIWELDSELAHALLTKLFFYCPQTQRLFTEMWHMSDRELEKEAEMGLVLLEQLTDTQRLAQADALCRTIEEALQSGDLSQLTSQKVELPDLTRAPHAATWTVQNDSLVYDYYYRRADGSSVNYIPQQPIDVLPNYCVYSADGLSLNEVRRGVAQLTDEPLVQDDSGAWHASFAQGDGSMYVKWHDMRLTITQSGTLPCAVPQWYP